MLDTILRDFREQRVRFVTLEQALADPAYKINPNYPYQGERTFLEQVAEARNLNIASFTDTTYPEDKLKKVCNQ